MAGEHTQHAKKVTETFKNKLSQSGREHVGSKHFEELELLIEMALATSVNDERERVASALDGFTKQLRNSEYSD